MSRGPPDGPAGVCPRGRSGVDGVRRSSRRWWRGEPGGRRLVKGTRQPFSISARPGAPRDASCRPLAGRTSARRPPWPAGCRRRPWPSPEPSRSSGPPRRRSCRASFQGGPDRMVPSRLHDGPRLRIGCRAPRRKAGSPVVKTTSAARRPRSLTREVRPQRLILIDAEPHPVRRAAGAAPAPFHVTLQGPRNLQIRSPAAPPPEAMRQGTPPGSVGRHPRQDSAATRHKKGDGQEGRAGATGQARVGTIVMPALATACRSKLKMARQPASREARAIRWSEKPAPPWR